MTSEAWFGIAAAAVGTAAATVGALGVIDNRRLSVSSYTLSPRGLPDGFSGMRLVHLSDLHATSFGRDQERLLNAIAALEPEAVMITGDLIDRRRTHTDEDMRPALTLLQALADTVPTYRVDGNHEPMSTVSKRFGELAAKTGIPNVTGQAITLTRNGDTLQLIGIPDVAVFRYDYAAWEQSLHTLSAPHAQAFRLVLSHRPQLFSRYVREGLPLVLSGHAHGGQWRLPFVGGLFAPQQGIFPTYTEGVHTDGETTMVISRGLGNSGFPLRLGNPPEIVAITLTSGT